MATSGDNTLTLKSINIIQEAYELIGALGEGETTNTEQISSAQRTLNMLVKNWQADGLNLWAVQRQFLFVNPGQQSYTLGPSTTDHFTTNFGKTTILSQTDANNVVIEDDSQILAGDYVGFQTTENTMEWTTVSSVDTGTNTVTTDDTVQNLLVGGIVYYYTSKASRPMSVMSAYLRTGNNTDIPMGIVSRIDYNELSVKNSAGLPNQAYYDPQRIQGILYVWPTGSAATDYIQLIVQRSLDDFDDPVGLDDVDYPQEWYLPLAYGLAKAIAPKFGLPDTDYRRIVLQAEEYYEMARGFDSELYTSVYFKPDTLQQDSAGYI
jgi:hypothetical protein